MNKFNVTVRAAVAEARKQGKINLRQQLRILGAIALSNIGSEVEALVATEMALEPTAAGLIDWENFDPEKFLVLVEAILKILLAFGIGI